MLVPFWLFLIFQSANFISFLLNTRGWRSELGWYGVSFWCHVCWHIISFLSSSAMHTVQGICLCSVTPPFGLRGALKDLHGVLYVTDLAGHNLIFLFLLLNVINVAKANMGNYLHLATLTSWSGTCGRLVPFLSLPASLLTCIVE